MKTTINGVEMFVYELFFDKYDDPGTMMAHPELLGLEEIGARCSGVVTSAPLSVPTKADLMRIGFVPVEPSWIPLWSLTRER